MMAWAVVIVLNEWEDGGQKEVVFTIELPLPNEGHLPSSFSASQMHNVLFSTGFSKNPLQTGYEFVYQINE